MTSPSMQGERTGATNAQGIFLARLLPPGNYTIEVIRDGFQTARHSRVIGMDQHYQPRVVLQTVAGATVEVIASAMTAIDPTDVKTSTNFDTSRIDTLPMGRGVGDMVLFTPGVTQGVNNRTQIRGAMTSGNLFLIDGQNVADNMYGTFGTHFVDSSYEETQVITGAISAEYGNVDGGVVNTITKSGGNQFSGEYRVEMTNNAWNAQGPYRAKPTNAIAEFKSYTLGGYFWKDKLWFHVSLYETEALVDSVIGGTIGTGGAWVGGPGTQFTQSTARNYSVYKLTYLINQDHTLVASYSKNDVEVSNAAGYSPGEIAALTTQTEESTWWNVSWRAIWNPSFNTELRFGAREQTIIAGPNSGDQFGSPLDRSPIQSYAHGNRWMNNGIFAWEASPRKNQTANFKASYFTNWNGTHELDFGIDYYSGSLEGMNAQSVSGYSFYCFDFNGNARTGTPDDYAQWITQWAKATKDTYGIYINDKWKLDNHWAFQIGLRWDTYTAKATDVKDNIASASGFSPRLGVTYDLFGDQKWIFKASYCMYQANVLETLTSAVSMAESVAYYFYEWDGPAGFVPISEITKLSNYDRTPYGGIDPTLNVRVDSGMKAPSVNEFQLGASYSFETEDWGKGYVSLTYVSKDWSNLIDYDIYGGTDRSYSEIGGFWVDNRNWGNSSDAERTYKALELATAYSYEKWNVTGAVTWSDLQGNYEGEGTSSPGTGQGINYYRTNLAGDVLYEKSIRTPVGNLTGDRPLVMRWTADYTTENRFGRTSVGLIYRFQSGTPYSYTRVMPRAALSTALPSGFGTTWTQYYDNQRTHGRYESLAYHDMSVTQDFNLFKVAGVQVRAFAKIIVYNFPNHRQLYSRGIGSFNVNAAGANTAWHQDNPWVKNANFGVISSNANYGSPRSIRLAAGVRF